MKCCDYFLKQSNLSTFIHLFKHIFWIMALNGTFKALQKKWFGPKNFELHAWVKKCHFGNFSERAGMAIGHALLVWPSKMHQSIWKILFVLGAHDYQERLFRRQNQKVCILLFQVILKKGIFLNTSVQNNITSINTINVITTRLVLKQHSRPNSLFDFETTLGIRKGFSMSS